MFGQNNSKSVTRRKAEEKARQNWYDKKAAAVEQRYKQNAAKSDPKIAEEKWRKNGEKTAQNRIKNDPVLRDLYGGSSSSSSTLKPKTSDVRDFNQRYTLDFSGYGSNKLPLNLYISGQSQSYVKLKVRAGLVDGLEPTLNGAAISSKDAEVEISKSATSYAYLKLAYSDEFDAKPANIEISIESSDNMQTSDDGKIAYIKLAKIEGGKPTNFLGSSLSTHLASPDLLYWAS